MTVRARYIVAKTIKLAFGSWHCDSSQFYSLNRIYIYIPSHRRLHALCPDETQRDKDDFNEDGGEAASGKDNSKYDVVRRSMSFVNC